MELASTVFDDILGPLAAFPSGNNGVESPYPEQSTSHSVTGVAGHNVEGHSQDERTITWRVDGADVDGRRIFATPRFVVGRPPLRVDVYLPLWEDYSRPLKAALRPEQLIYTTGSDVSKLPVTRHVMSALESWSSAQPDFEAQYNTVPFGSQILVTEVTATIEDTAAGICLCPDYDVEQAMLTVDELHSMWNLSVGQWPPVLELDDIGFVRQLHEAISLVTVSNGSSTTTDPDKAYVFKSLTRDQRYLYNELRMLLTLLPHPNLIRRPSHIITKRARFGGKPGVCGFLLEYYPLGSLKQRLLHCDSPIPKRQKAKWARQIGQVLMHINATEGGFYPDLKPDNVVLRASKDGDSEDAVLLDLEQRGGWYSWSPPEVLYIEYMEMLATGLSEEHASLREEVMGLLARYMPGWKPSNQRDRYHNSVGGFSSAWLALLNHRDGKERLEKAQVFMLGKMIWCLFEDSPMVRCGIDWEILQDPDPPHEAPRFPAFRVTTDERIRELVRRCTLGAPEWYESQAQRGEVITLRKGRLVSIARQDQGGDESGGDVKGVARRWWAAEVERAMQFLRELVDIDHAGSLKKEMDECVRSRPTLAEVVGQLGALEEEWSAVG
ncbi:hypothetical protein QBC47DRAFT_308241 [Echria macrotheca]|uniref:Protein kinase domain-containing protein n=1 Tax=Echria macrotheca TaxID=438768 RepID=A0AAJ0F5B0_9PEZI|nr:hypothetical protein QBC47DRAFT_308241 [Echria macrotheca]